MSKWEPNLGATDEWYTPRHVFDALGCEFDMDVAAPRLGPRYVPAREWLCDTQDGLSHPWSGFVWMNPPFGGRNALSPWLDRFFDHGNGIALTPDRTSAPWWQDAANRCDAMLLTRGKIKFERPDGSVGASPGAGVTLWAAGEKAMAALFSAQAAGLGKVWRHHMRDDNETIMFLKADGWWDAAYRIQEMSSALEEITLLENVCDQARAIAQRGLDGECEE